MSRSVDLFIDAEMSLEEMSAALGLCIGVALRPDGGAGWLLDHCAGAGFRGRGASPARSMTLSLGAMPRSGEKSSAVSVSLANRSATPSSRSFRCDSRIERARPSACSSFRSG